MSPAPTSPLFRQLDTAWALATYHLAGLETDECLWRPAPTGPHVHRDPDDRWTADWPEYEGYDLGPPSIAWLTWHISYWWSMVIDHSFGPGTLTRESIHWPGDAQSAVTQITGLHDRWREEVLNVPMAEFDLTTRTRWPFTSRPFSDVIAWVNVELTKNAAEIGYARFLYATRQGGP